MLKRQILQNNVTDLLDVKKTIKFTLNKSNQPNEKENYPY